MNRWTYRAESRLKGESKGKNTWEEKGQTKGQIKGLTKGLTKSKSSKLEVPKWEKDLWLCEKCGKPDNKPFHQWCSFCKDGKWMQDYQEAPPPPKTWKTLGKGKGKALPKSYLLKGGKGPKGKGSPHQDQMEGLRAASLPPSVGGRWRSNVNGPSRPPGLTQNSAKEDQETSANPSLKDIKAAMQLFEVLKALPGFQDFAVELNSKIQALTPEETKEQKSQRLRSAEDQLTDRNRKLKEAQEWEEEVMAQAQQAAVVRTAIEEEINELQCKVDALRLEMVPALTPEKPSVFMEVEPEAMQENIQSPFILAAAQQAQEVKDQKGSQESREEQCQTPVEQKLAREGKGQPPVASSEVGPLSTGPRADRSRSPIK